MTIDDSEIKQLQPDTEVDNTTRRVEQINALQAASSKAHKSISRPSLQSGTTNSDFHVEDHRTKLSLAAEAEQGIRVRFLLGTGGSDPKPESMSRDGRTPLSLGAKAGHAGVMRSLLRIGKTDLDSKATDGRTPLSFAAGAGRESATKLLSGTGKADPDAKSSDGRTPRFSSSLLQGMKP